MGMDGADLQRAAYKLDAAELEAACLGFHRAHPHRSAKRSIYITQWLAFIALIAVFVWAAQRAPALTWGAVHYVALAVFGVAIAWRLIAASNLKRLLWRLASPAKWPNYTILCPLYREANVVPDLVASLRMMDYPRDALQVILLVEGDDHETLNAAVSASTSPAIEVVVVPAATPRTKPKALNAGLARARGEFLVVYDAEDRPHPQQLRAALASFQDGGEQLACVQAPLDIDNASDSWIARQFAAEYAIQFREMLPMLARWKLPLPLGGSSNHFKTAALRATGGWDPFNVSKDGAQNAMNSKRFSEWDMSCPIRVPFAHKCLVGKRNPWDPVNVREKTCAFAHKISVLSARDFSRPVPLSFLWVTAKSA